MSALLASAESSGTDRDTSKAGLDNLAQYGGNANFAPIVAAAALRFATWTALAPIARTAARERDIYIPSILLVGEQGDAMPEAVVEPTTITDGTAFVLDVGAENTYWGYAGQDSPLQSQASAWCDFPADGGRQRSRYPACFFEYREHYRPQSMVMFSELSSPLREYTGLDAAEGFFASKVNKDLLVHTMDYISNFFPGDESLKDRPLLMTQTSQRTGSCSTVFAELAFESAGVGALFTGRKASLTALALGRPTALVAELGPVISTFTPVFEGYTLSKNCDVYEIGSCMTEWMVADYLKLWNSAERSFSPQFCPFRNIAEGATAMPEGAMTDSPLAATDPLYLHFARRAIVRDIAMSSVFVSTSGLRSRPDPSNQMDEMSDATDTDDVPYELPDGKLVFLPKQTCENFGEFYFNPSAVGGELFAGHGSLSALGPRIRNWPGLATSICQTAFRCDIELVSSLLSNVVVAGGPASTKGLMERLAAELDALDEVNVEESDWTAAAKTARRGKSLTNIKLKTASLPRTDRRYTSWLGGSILCSLGSFERLWVSRSEWQEFGDSILAKRFVL